MKSRRFIYSRIRTVKQLRTERESLEWHIKGIENRFKSNIPISPSKGSRLAIFLPVAITTFTLVRQINRCVQRIREK
ncbi:MAG: hypothetical protein RBR62_06760 [Bacteroidales bacterium]|jgi:hypothetical protein|nr:hypothetical protein [Bacteroidales bacterium]